MTKKESKFVGVNLPKYIIRDLDTYLIINKIKTSRASFIVGMLNDFLDNEASEEYQKTKGKTKKEMTLRAQRYWLSEGHPMYTKEEQEHYMKKYKELTKKIEEL